MRLIFLLAVTTLLLVALPASACGGGPGGAPEEGSYQYCNDYRVHVGDESNGLHANEHGQFYLATQTFDTGFGGMYFEQDAKYADPNNPWLLSFWWYFEANERPGMQRADEGCNNTPEGEDSDVMPC